LGKQTEKISVRFYEKNELGFFGFGKKPTSVFRFWEKADFGFSVLGGTEFFRGFFCQFSKYKWWRAETMNRRLAPTITSTRQLDTRQQLKVAKCDQNRVSKYLSEQRKNRKFSVRLLRKPEIRVFFRKPTVVYTELCNIFVRPLKNLPWVQQEVSCLQLSFYLFLAIFLSIFLLSLLFIKNLSPQCKM